MADDLKRVGLVFNAEGAIDFTKSLKQINTLTKENYSSFKLAQSQYDKNTTSVEKLRNAQKYLSDNTEVYRSKVEVLSKQLEELENAENRNEQEISKKRTALNNAQSTLNNYEKGLKEVNAKLKSGSEELKEYAENIDEFSSKTKDAGETLTKGLTAPIIAAGSAGILMADELKSAVNTYISTTGTATSETEKFKDIIESIYENNYGESFDDIAEALAQVRNQIGPVVDHWDPSALQEFTESAIALRDVFGFDISESVRSANMLMNTFGIDGLDAMNMIAEGAQNGLDKNQDLLDTINEYSVHFSKLGLDAYDMFQVLENGAENGAFSIDKVADSVKELSIRVVDGSDTTKQGFEQIGLNADEMSKKFAQGGETAREAFIETIDALAKMEDPMQQNIAGVNLFGTMWEDLGPTVITSLADIENSAYGTSNALDKIKQTKYDDLKNQVQTLGKTFISNFAIPLGETLLPIITRIVEIITGWVSKFGELSSTMQTVIGIVGIVVASIGPLLVIIGAVGSQIASAIGFLSQFKLALFGGTEGVGGLASALSSLTAPMVAVIATIALVVAAVINLWNTNEGFRNNVISIVNNIMSIIQNLYNSVIQPIISVIIELLKNLWTNSIQPLWEQFKSFIASIASLIQSFMAIATPIINTLVSLLGTFLTPAVKAIGSVFSSVFGAISKTIQSFLSTATSIFNSVASIFRNLKESMTKPMETAKSVIKGIIDAIKGFFSFKIKWPKIPLPHFSIKPKGWGIGDLLKGKIPSLGIEWYAKAMDKGMILDQATIFGINGQGQLMGAGEAGSETIVGTDSLMSMIRSAASANNNGIIERLERIIELLVMFFPNIIEQLDSNIVLDDGTLIGKLIPRINKELGKEASYDSRK